METDQLLELLQHGNQLKQTARAGWVQRGVPQAENVAAHSYGVIYAALLLAELIDQPLDLAAVLIMATLHDLPEGLTTDIPTPAWRFLPKGSKEAAERAALATIFHETPFRDRFSAFWEQMRAGESPEARLVHDADKLDQFLQAYLYEQQTGNRRLDEFWISPYRFHFRPAQAVYDELCRRRERPSLTAG